MSKDVKRRQLDVLWGALLGLSLGITSNIWVAVADHLFLDNMSIRNLWIFFSLVSLAILGLGYLLWHVIHQLESPETPRLPRSQNTGANEAGRAVMNYGFLKDLFEACMMYNVDYLVIAIRRIYKTSRDFNKVITFFDTLYSSRRISLPLNGVLVIGY